jgi:hypothetical protein
MTGVQLSVILVVGERRDRARMALASLLSQELEEGTLEVLLIDCAPDAPAVGGSDHPNVRRIKAAPSTSFAAAKALGVTQAQAPVIAFLEEHAFVASGWARALLAAHRGPWAAVGAEVYNSNPSRRLSRVVALMNYHPWLPPAPRAEFCMLPGHNVSFKRDALLAYPERLAGLFRAEIVLHTRLHLDGQRLLLEPEAKFFHLNEVDLRACIRGFFLFHRLYGPVRAEEFGWSAGRRALYVLGTPLIPLYFLLRFSLTLARRRPDLLPGALAAMPFMFVFQIAGALGQAVGLTAGMGNAEAEFSRHELVTDRGPHTCMTPD